MYNNKTLDELGIQAKGDYALVDDIPTKVSELDNDSNYLTSIPAEYVTDTELQSKGYATETYVKNEIANAQLGGGDTEIDLSGYATKDELANKVDKETGKSLIANSEIERLANVTNYDDTAIKNQINSKASISDMTDYIEEHKDELKGDKGDTGERGIQGIQGVQGIQGEKGDDGYTPIKGTDYFTAEDKQEIVNETASKISVPTKTSQLTNDSGFLTSVPSQYVTETELTGKGYLTSVPSTYKTKTENDALYQAKGNYLTSIPSEYITETELEEAISNVGGGVIEPLADDIPKVFINGSIPTDKTELEAELTYMSKTEEFHSYIKIKCQGNSSMSYPKKNFTVKLYSDEERSTKLKKNFRGWGKESKFCLKANYIDHSHARNIISANLWADVVKSRSNYDSLPEELRTSPNNGAIDGFPIKVYNNGTYQGIYTWNIPKDGWMTNMDDELDTHCILCSENYISGCFRATANIDGNDWTDELHDTVPNSIKTSFNNAINHVMNSTDAEFKANLSNYFDVPSLIDYYIFQYAICGLDSMGKNQLYFTYDGTHWIASSYDMDSTFGLYWNGSRFVSTEYRMQEDYESMQNGYSGNLLYMRLEENFVDEIKARYSELRTNVLNYSNMFTKFERFTDLIGKDLYEEDVTIYTGIPSPTTNNITQIRNYIRDRLTYVDGEIENLLIPIECTGITLNTNTLEFTSTDTKTLIATVEPSDTTDIIVWASDDTTVAKVNNGVVTPLKNGNCIITATCGSQSATCNVNVSGLDEPVEEENILVSNYIADGTGFVYTNDINFENQYIEASIDVSNVQGGNINILDIGENIPDWNSTTNMHCYYSAGNTYIRTYLVFDGTDHYWDITIPSTKFKIKLSNEGLFIDNVLYEPTGWQPLYTESIEKLLALTTVQIGSKEGSKLSTATYEYIKIANNN